MVDDVQAVRAFVGQHLASLVHHPERGVNRKNLNNNQAQELQ